MKTLTFCLLALFLGVGAYAQDAKKDSAIVTSFSVTKKEWKDTVSTSLTGVKKREGFFKRLFKGKPDEATTNPIETFKIRNGLGPDLSDDQITIMVMKDNPFSAKIPFYIRSFVINQRGGVWVPIPW